jgi:protein-S-isoprenylcysteine O-methyltransferase Ste14
MYAAEATFMIAVALESANWLVALPMIAGTAALCARVRKEETMMIERFGDNYRAYMKRTGRFLPRIKHSSKQM